MAMRPPKPGQVGDTVTLWDKEEKREVQVTVDEVRWDGWLYGGEYRIFGYRAGPDDEAAYRMYYSTRDLR